MEKVISIYRRYRLLILGAIALLALSLLIKGYIRNSIDRQKAEDALAVNLRQAQSIPTTNGQKVVQVQVEGATSHQVAMLSDSLFRLEKSQARLIRENSRLSVLLEHVRLKDTLRALYVDTAALFSNDCDSLRDFAVMTPAPFLYESDSITIGGIVRRSGVDINHVFLPNRMYERDVVLKKGLLGLGRKRTTQYFSTNTLWSVDSAQVLTVDRSPSWWYRTGKPAAASFIATAITIAVMKSILNH